MKVIFNKLFIAFSVLSLACIFSSCKNDLMTTTYTPENENVTFKSTESVFLLEDKKELSVEVVRGVANAALEIPVTITDETGTFKLVNSTVSFASGEFTSKVVLNYTFASILPGVEYSFKLKFPEEYKAFTGVCDFKGVCYLKLEYEDYGEITCLSSGPAVKVFEMENTEFKIQKAKLTNTFYRILNFMNSGVDVDFNYALDEKSGEYIIKVTAPDSKMLYGFPSVRVKTSMTYEEDGTDYGNIFMSFVSEAGAAKISTLNSDDTITVGTVLTLNGVMYAVELGTLFKNFVSERFEVTTVY